ncbi:hypothetical protein CLPU_9c00970 [Gottschalkia purinilytica]|uniref:ABC-2 family transporter protein n=1 Tax=Gottschalkia purinilytica TaxID=1503 RepID=A0A0L0W9S9_GOTPU|nr:ABC transporter permease [Gottschalkia purinilytica]KNF08201.1 hypothetical protein CLPU_9c00970 [Gottschalkia purinilytica]
MIRLLKSELLKLKNSGIFSLLISIPIFILLLSFAREKKGFIDWIDLYVSIIPFYAQFLFPILICVIMAILMKIEHSGNGWRKMLSLPIRRGNFYITKLIIGYILVLINVILVSCALVLIGKINGITDPINYEVLFKGPIIAYISAFPIILIQYLLSVNLTNSLYSIGIGLILNMPAILAANSKRFWMYYIWDYPILSFYGGFNEALQKEFNYPIASLIIFSIIFLVGLVCLKRRDVLN